MEVTEWIRRQYSSRIGCEREIGIEEPKLNEKKFFHLSFAETAPVAAASESSSSCRSCSFFRLWHNQH